MKTEEGKLEAQQKQLNIPVVMHSILSKVITEAYRRGYAVDDVQLVVENVDGTDVAGEIKFRVKPK